MCLITSFHVLVITYLPAWHYAITDTSYGPVFCLSQVDVLLKWLFGLSWLWHVASFDQSYTVFKEI